MRLSQKQIIAALLLAATVTIVHAAPPEGKGPGQNQGQGNGKGQGHGKDQGNDNGPGKGNGNGNNQGNKKSGRDDGVSVDLRHAGITVSVARGYAVQYGATGMAGLPPGIQKNLARGKPLPPGIAKKMVPAGMLAHLPVYPGYEWRIAGSDLILVAIAGGIIADVLFDVFR
ncbi:anti-virulence regulator CigR family protein [Pseudomonadota bacterium AL_CKDN230030165-1A_HGKHYDSX7]